VNSAGYVVIGLTNGQGWQGRFIRHTPTPQAKSRHTHQYLSPNDSLSLFSHAPGCFKQGTSNKYSALYMNT
jgi:hypothetical protein